MLDIISTPFGYLMRYLYQWTGNYAFSLLVFALVVKLVLLPLTIHQRKSSVTQARLRPKELAIRKRYAGRTDAEAKLQMATEIQAMYKEEHYSVAGGCLPLLIQFPIIIALYNIVRDPLTHISRLAADTVTAIQTKALELVKAGEIVISGATAETTALTQIQMSAAVKNYPDAFIGIVPTDLVLPDFTMFGIDMSATPTLALSAIIIFPILAGAFQWLTSFVMTKFMPNPSAAATTPTGEKSSEAEAAERTMKSMNIVMPLVTIFIGFKLPAIMALYWVYQSILGILSTLLVYKLFPLPTFTPEEIAAVEAEMNKDYVPIPAPKTSSGRSSGKSLHHIDDEDEYEEGETVEVTDYTEVSEDEESKEEPTPTHREESAPRVRYDKNGNPIKSLHYIDFDEEESTPAADEDTTNE